MAASLVLGIDIGTGGARALLVEAGSGRVIARQDGTWPSSSPHPGWSEQDPDAWWSVTAAVIRALVDGLDDPSSVQALAFAGQMHGLVLRDASGAVLRPAILWNDQRTESQRNAIHEQLGVERCIDVTGKPVLTGFTAPKLAWVQEHEPQIAQRIASINLPKDHVVFRATGVHAIDAADASGTSWLDIQTRDWSPEICKALGVDPAWLPQVHECSEVVGRITAEAAAYTGLPEGTPVVAGAGDQAASGLACGVTNPGLVSVTIGTSGVVFAHSETPPRDSTGSLHGFCHAVEGAWHWMGCMLCAGGSLEWYRNAIAPDATYEELIDEAMTAPAGCEGLCFLPYLSGERCPHDDPRARGAFIGLTTRHGRSHMTRSVLEGIAFGLADMLQLIRDTGQSVDTVRLAGGAARSDAWRQLLADVFDATVEAVNEPDATAYGAALLAMVGAGLEPDAATAASSMVQVTDTTTPSGLDYAPTWQRWRTL
ncbi:MAG: xylulokinase [Planctomycetota bacterium]|nr:xylulokinase [Planctomycetota bacterium]